MNELNILITFAGGLAAALVFGYIAHHLKIPPSWVTFWQVFS